MDKFLTCLFSPFFFFSRMGLLRKWGGSSKEDLCFLPISYAGSWRLCVATEQAKAITLIGATPNQEAEGMEEAIDEILVEGMVEGMIEGIVEAIIDLARRRRKMEDRFPTFQKILQHVRIGMLIYMVMFLVCFWSCKQKKNFVRIFHHITNFKPLFPSLTYVKEGKRGFFCQVFFFNTHVWFFAWIRILLKCNNYIGLIKNLLGRFVCF